MKVSCGMLLYKKIGNELKVLLVHPSGNYNAKAAWSIPKGEPNQDEDYLVCALRETKEETGIDETDYMPHTIKDIGSSKYQSGAKIVFCFAKQTIKEPGTLSWEIDKAEFLTPKEAKQKIHKDQAVFIDRLLELAL